MPRKRKRPDIGRRSRVNVQRATLRSNRTNDQREADNDNSRTGMGELRSRVNNYEVDRQRMERVRAHRSQQQRARDNEFNRFRRRNAPVNLERGAFSYDPEIDYSADKSVTIGEMSIICQHCKALKYSSEPAGLCCAGGKVQFPQLVPQSEPLHSLVNGMESESKHFLANIQKYNNCFQMTSFGATHIVQDGFMPTFKMSTAIIANMELPDENKQNINLYSIIKKENEESFDNGYVENISSFINIKDEVFESTETDSNSNDKRSLKTKQISDTCNMNCQFVSSYCDGEQQIFEFQVKEESEKISDEVMELDEHREQNKNLYPVKLEDESIEHSSRNNTNDLINAKDEFFEASETDVKTEISEFIKNHKTLNIQKSKESPILKYLLTSDEKSHNEHKISRTNLADLRTRDSNIYIIHPDNNGDKLMVDEVVLHEQSVREDVSEMLIIKESKNMLSSKEIETDQIQSCFNMLNSVNSRQLRTYTGDKPFTCDVCHKSFSEKFNLKTHLKRHTGEKPFNCEVCHKSFLLVSYLRIHLRTHTGEKPFNCEVCNKSFSQSGYLRGHLRTHTGEKPFNCDVCHKSFSTRSNLKSHLTTHTEEKPFNCDVCHKSFSEKFNLKAHLRTHKEEKPFNCEVCHKSFSQRIIMEIHLRTHTGEKPFNCEMCHKSFSRKNILKAHLRTHTGEKPFTCGICHKSFSQDFGLKRHLRIHKGDKPFNCEVCNKSFSQSSHLKGHLKTHSEEKPSFNCEVCNKSFSNGVYFKRHLKSHTKEIAKALS